MPDAPVMVSPNNLETFIVATLMAMKMPRTPAEITAGLMVRTDLRGVDSHGIGMLPRYVEWWREGYLVLDAAPRIERDDGAVALLDAGKCLGHYPATLAMEKAIEKAKAYGIGIATVRNSSHFGAAGNYSMMASVPSRSSSGTWTTCSRRSSRRRAPRARSGSTWRASPSSRARSGGRRTGSRWRRCWSPSAISSPAIWAWPRSSADQARAIASPR
jgi:hypothetical protein